MLQMSEAPSRTGNVLRLFGCCCGLTLILAATVLNLISDWLLGGGAGPVPSFVWAMYASFGKLGITLLLVVIGLAFIALGRTFSSSEDPNAQTASPLARRPLFYFPTDDPPEGPLPNGTVVLRTRKYLKQR
jgi:hypothetical protein